MSPVGRRARQPRTRSRHAIHVTAREVLAYRRQAMRVDRRLPAGSLADAAWGGLQDSVPRGGVVSLHARVEAVTPDAWEDPSLVQIWFRGGADYLVPRADVGVFTLGSLPRDPERARGLDALADAIHRLTGDRATPSRELPLRLGGRPLLYRQAARTGRVHIRWDASNTWVIPVERPSIDAEDARRELARRFLHWLGPRNAEELAVWTGVGPKDSTEAWRSIESELVPVEVDGLPGTRHLLAADEPLLRRREDSRDRVAASPVARLLPQDDPYTKFDHALLIPDEVLRPLALPKVGSSPGYIPGVVLLDGEVVGAWHRQARKVTMRPFESIDADGRAAIEIEALAVPIAGPGEPRVCWDELPTSAGARS